MVSLVLRVIIGGLLGLLFLPFTKVSIGIIGLFGIVSTVFAIAVIVFSILAMIRAYQYVDYDIPIIPHCKLGNRLLTGKKD